MASRFNQVEAMNRLACMYGKGHGVIKDSQKSVSLFKRASDLGYAKAQCNLGLCYLSGEGV